MCAAAMILLLLTLCLMMVARVRDGNDVIVAVVVFDDGNGEQ